MESQGANFGFDALDFNMNFDANLAPQSFTKPAEGDTDSGFFFGDEGIDATGSSFDQPFDIMNAGLYSAPQSDFALPTQNLTMDNTLGGASAWNAAQLTPPINDLASIPAQSFSSAYPLFGSNSKRPLRLDTDDFPQPKRHESAAFGSTFASPFLPTPSVTTASWSMDGQLTPSSNSVDVGLSDEAADVCATWFSKYAVLPSDRHIESLSQLTGEPAPTIRQWFGQMLKQGMVGHDSAYKSQTSFSQQDQSFGDVTSQGPPASEVICNHDTTSNPQVLRRGKKGCTPTNRPELLSRDPSKIYQCTRKCGKRYGRKCDWKRNEEEGYPSKSWVCSLCIAQGVEKVKPCFRRYHFSQHFRNIHPGFSSADYEEASTIYSDTAFPRRCGFCSHRFKSRKNRIDHIADHFKKGKCMLDWVDQDDSDDNSDDTDDEDDGGDDGGDDNNPDNNDFLGNDGSLGGQPDKGPQGCPGPQQDSSDGNGGSGPSGQYGHLGQFQLPLFNNNSTRGQSPGAGQHIKSCSDQAFAQRKHEEPAKHSIFTTEHGGQCSTPDNQCSILQQPRNSEAEEDDTDAVVRDVVARPLINGDGKQSAFGLKSALIANLSGLLVGADSRCPEPPELDRDDISRPSSTLDRTDVFKRHLISIHKTEQDVDTGTSKLVSKNPITVADAQEFYEHVLSRSLSDRSAEEIQPLLQALISAGTSLQDNQQWNEEAILNFLAQLQQLKHHDAKPHDTFAATSAAKGDAPKTVRGDSAEYDRKDDSTAHEPNQAISEAKQTTSDGRVAIVGTACRFPQTSPEDLWRTLCQSGVRNPPNQIDPNIFDEIARDLYTDPMARMALFSPREALGMARPVSEEASSVATAQQDISTLIEDLYLKSQSFVSVKLLGTGGFSMVDEVVHRETKLRIGRKTLKNREQSAMEELKKEVQVLQKLRHPHIIRFLGAYSKSDKVSILLSPVADTTLAVWLDKCYLERPTELLATVVKMAGCLSSSLRYLHEQRPVVKHMDIKPQNILVMQGDHGIPHVVLSDFGISSCEERAPIGGSKPLTRQYCAPEVPSGIAREQAADIWSLGCVFLEMLTVALSQDNLRWLDFRKEFSGRKGKYYWQEVPRLHEWLFGFLDQASTLKEAIALRTVKSMLNENPADRPNASTLTMVFTPAPCCLSWPNEKVSFPGPLEEQKMVEMFVHGDSVGCLTELHVCGDFAHKQQLEPFTRAKKWLQECIHDHEACRRQWSGAKPLPTRLVDLQPDGLDGDSVRVMNSNELDIISDQINYVALSHLWSDSDPTLSSDRLLSMQDGLLREQLPKAINDAFSAASSVGYRYVWVDSLCVVQDSIEDKRQECITMASIYRNAGLTIVTAKTNDPIDSGTNAKDHDWYSPGFAWDTRAWGLQERLLSRRLLHLASGQLYWECNALKASETFPEGMPALYWEYIHTMSANAC